HGVHAFALGRETVSEFGRHGHRHRTHIAEAVPNFLQHLGQTLRLTPQRKRTFDDHGLAVAIDTGGLDVRAADVPTDEGHVYAGTRSPAAVNRTERRTTGGVG